MSERLIDAWIRAIGLQYWADRWPDIQTDSTLRQEVVLLEGLVAKIRHIEGLVCALNQEVEVLSFQHRFSLEVSCGGVLAR